MAGAITRLKSVRSSPSVAAVPVVVQTPTDPQVSQIIEEIDKENLPKGASMRRRKASVGSAMYKLGALSLKSMKSRKTSESALNVLDDPSTHADLSVQSSPCPFTDEQLAAQKATVRDVSLARLPSGPLNASPRRPADVLVLPEDAPEEELQEAIVKAQPRLRLQKTKVHDDPVGLLPPSPQDVESIAEQLKKNRRFLTPGSSPAGSGDLKSSDVAQEDPSTGRGLGLIMRKVQHNKIVMAAVSRFSQLSGVHLQHHEADGKVIPSEEELLKRGVDAFISAAQGARRGQCVDPDDVVGEIHFSGHSARVARKREVRFEVQEEPELPELPSSAPGSTMLSG